MDEIMKVFDHTVREIKREVNLKVLKVPEIEQKVLDATSDEPWGPHGSDLADIARATNKFGECEIIMKVLLQRLGGTDANWRHLYKTLAVIEYLLANGTQRSVGEIIDNSSRIGELTRFKFVEPNGKDVGLNVRKKAETVLAIVDDRQKLQQVREKAAATRDKYLGLSSTGITYKSSASAFGNGSYSSGRPYGSTGGSRESASFKDSYTTTEWSKSPKDPVSRYSSTTQRSKETTNSANSYKSIKRGSKSSLNPCATSGVPSSQKGENEDDSYDFNPRGSSASDGLANVSSNHVDLFGPSLMGNLLDTAAEAQVDLFVDADFQADNTSLEVASGSHAQDNIDLFAGRPSLGGSVTSEHNLSSRAHPSASSLNSFQPSFATSIPSDREFTVRDTPSKPSEGKPPTPENLSNTAFGPFAAIALKNFDGSDSFGAFSSSTGSFVTELTHDSAGGNKNSDRTPLEELNLGAFTLHKAPTEAATESTNKSPTEHEQASMPSSRLVTRKETFQIKSGIWADFSSRGLIDLNITAHKYTL